MVEPKTPESNKSVSTIICYASLLDPPYSSDKR